MKKWRDNRFGQFIHWSLYSIPRGVWEGKTYGYAAEFLKASAGLKKQDRGYYLQNTKTGAVYMIVLNVPIPRQLRVELPNKIS